MREETPQGVRRFPTSIGGPVGPGGFPIPADLSPADPDHAGVLPDHVGGLWGQLLAVTSDAVLVIVNDRAVSWNEPFRELLGAQWTHPAGEAVPAGPALEAISGLLDDPGAFLVAVHGCRVTGVPRTGLRFARQSGGELTANLLCAGEVTALVMHPVGPGHLVAERAADSVKVALAEALALAAQRSELLSAVSHEVRTPLTGVLGMVELLLLEPLPDAIRETVIAVRSSGNAVLELLDNLLGMTRMDLHQAGPNLAPTSLRELVDSVAATLGRSARSKGLALSWEVDPAVPETIMSDEGRLRQVLLNLVGNAVKFTSAGEVGIVVTAGSGRSGSRWGSGTGAGLEIAVHDTGPGMSDSEVELVFDPFVQGLAGFRAGSRGVGLGLAITRRLVESLGGWIKVDSIPELGSVFRVGLPAEAGTAVPVGLGAPGPATHEWETQEWLAGISVLVAADLPLARSAVAASLGGAGSIWQAQLSDVWRAGRPDALVLVGDPQSQGLVAIADAAPARWPGVRVIILSVREMPPGSLPGAVVVPMPCNRRGLLRAVTGRVDAVAIHGDHAPQFPGSARILLADDDPVIQSMVAAMLEAMGLRVVVVGDGSAAVEAATASHFDAILMDVNMPVLDGLAATQQLRGMGGRAGAMPILALTASVMPEDIRMCTDVGMDAVVAKPVDLRGLYRALGPFVGLSAPPAGPLPPAGLALSGSQDAGRGATAAGSPDAMQLLDRELLGGLGADLGDTGIVAEMLGMFLDELPTRLAAIQEALGGGDPAIVKRAAHGLASPSATLGLPQLCAACREMEHDPASDLGEQRLARIGQAADKTRQAIAEYLSELGF